MDALTDAAAVAVLTAARVHKTDGKLFSLPDQMAGQKTSVPLDSQFQCQLAASAVRWLGGYERSFLIVTEWGIWPNDENWALFRAVLAGLDARISFDEIQVFGFGFASEESDLLVGLLRLVISFGWGGFLVRAGEPCIFAFSHDSWIQLGGELNRYDCQRELEELIASFGQ
jgi:hypothetical protein